MDSIQLSQGHILVAERVARDFTASANARTIQEEFPDLDEEGAKKVVSLMTGRTNQAGRNIEAIDKLLGGYGVEALRGEHHSNFYDDIVAEYVNMGDTDVTTIIHDCVSEDWLLMSYGDFVQRNERRYGIR